MDLTGAQWATIEPLIPEPRRRKDRAKLRSTNTNYHKLRTNPGTLRGKAWQSGRIHPLGCY